MTSEDFGFFSQKYPSTFFRFGVKVNQIAIRADYTVLLLKLMKKL
jgi:metal-dependent amidase/aminoacylase/carboxypeptidase family protein